jgi:hypothetical protein
LGENAAKAAGDALAIQRGWR